MRQISSFGVYLFLKPGHWINTLALFVVGEGLFAIWGHENIFKYLTLTLGNRFEPVLGELGGLTRVYASDQPIWSIFMPQIGSPI